MRVSPSDSVSCVSVCLVGRVVSFPVWLFPVCLFPVWFPVCLFVSFPVCLSYTLFVSFRVCLSLSHLPSVCVSFPVCLRLPRACFPSVLPALPRACFPPVCFLCLVSRQTYNNLPIRRAGGAADESLARLRRASE